MIRIDYKELLKDWEPVLRDSVLDSISMRLLIKKIHFEYKYKKVYPEKQDLFRAFKLTSFDSTRVVILGQDPYPNKHASGLAFGNDLALGHQPSPSLRLIENCVEKTIYDGLKLDFDHSLVNWSKQGVLLLNSALSVLEGEPSSHAIYWRHFTAGVLKQISERKTGVVFLLLGSVAKTFARYINADNNYVFTYVHPAYSARNNEEWDCPYFKEINTIIESQNGKDEIIKW